ncbi:efflux RND transporter permease subunit [Ferruginibacter sp. SUN106]|uniref:efflux RND transporter permease subunit n=1 Tax=Ferruginibacter sp. SUN106 TaxID=2978348 RepID=UPI003D35F86E
MWQRLGSFVIKNRLVLLIILFAATGVMGFFASQVKLSYEFARAIPVDNPKYRDYKDFQQRFGDDGNVLVMGVKTDNFFKPDVFAAYYKLHKQLRKVEYVEEILSIPAAIGLVKDTLTDKLVPAKIFSDSVIEKGLLDSAKNAFLNLSFYKYKLYNPDEHAYLMAVRINKVALNSAKRTKIVEDITTAVKAFETETKIETHLSGLPLIRTVVGDRIKKEMSFFLIGSLVLSALILLIFFRSISTTLLSLLVVLFGVVWSLGILELCKYKISLLTALIPPLVVVIGIPNCIYFINKYHTSYLKSNNKNGALVDMVSKMGVVTLFCNITAAIGFAVFALTKSAILNEFGVVAGISIMVIFFVSFILLPSVLSYLPAPKEAQTRYLNNRWLTSFLLRIETWVMHHKKFVYGITIVVLIFSVIGILKIKSVAYIVDDLPKTDKIYTDLKFFETNFKGVMPLEIVLDTKKPKGILKSTVDINKIAFFQDSFLAKQNNIAKPLSVIDGIKFTYQAISEGQGDSTYTLPAFGNPLKDLHDKLRQVNVRKENAAMTAADSATLKLIGSFIDSTEQYLRISMNMEDIGTAALPSVVDSIKRNANRILNGIDSVDVKDTANTTYNVTVTGTSSTFLEGSRFIVNGLKESVFWAFILISFCMLYLFKSARILLCSLIPNLIPLVITAGVMGWAGVPLKPSTVLVFSVALGIAIDITIRFLVNYKQELPVYNNDINATVSATIKNTGLSIVYTSLVLIAGFVIFCFSGFGGTKALGWLTSVTLFVATLTNLILLPVLLLLVGSKKKSYKD